MTTYNCYEGLFARARNRYFARVIERFVPLDAEVVDVGCGQGDFLSACQKAHRRSRGFDISEAWVRHCLQRGLPADVADLCSLPVADASIDAVFAQSVIEHVDPRNLMNEMTRILRPGGRCIVSAPTPEHAFWDDPTHLRPYTIKSLTTLFEMFGYTVIHRNYVLGELMGLTLRGNRLYAALNLIPFAVGSNVIVVGEKPRGPS